MSEPQRTTKYVRGAFTLTFHGDYLDRNECFDYFRQWVDDGLEDRDDLRAWSFVVSETQEVNGDPEGYDS